MKKQKRAKLGINAENPYGPTIGGPHGSGNYTTHQFGPGSDRRKRRSTLKRRASDQYTVVVQRIILGSGAIGVIYGQAEMLGEPWRHLLAVGAVVVLVGVALWMKVT